MNLKPIKLLATADNETTAFSSVSFSSNFDGSKVDSRLKYILAISFGHLRAIWSRDAGSSDWLCFLVPKRMRCCDWLLQTQKVARAAGIRVNPSSEATRVLLPDQNTGYWLFFSFPNSECSSSAQIPAPDFNPKNSGIKLFFQEDF